MVALVTLPRPVASPVGVQSPADTARLRRTLVTVPSGVICAVNPVPDVVQALSLLGSTPWRVKLPVNVPSVCVLTYACAWQP
jgi:hypothetical protein